MTLPDKRPVQSDFANLTDYSTCLWSNILTFDRRCAHLLVLEKFADCLNYISSINIHEQEY